MAEVKNAFIKSKMNKDLDARLLPNGEYREGVNIQVSKSEGADVGALENVLGNNKLVDFTALTGVNDLYTVGLYTDEVNNNIYVFLTDYDDTKLTDSSGNNIYNSQLLNYSPTANNFVYVYNIATQEPIQLLQGSFLNFSINFPIHSINLVENILFWTDNRNQPRRIEVDKAVEVSDYYTTEDQISVASYSPFQPIELYYKFEGFYKNADGTVIPVNANGGKGITSGITTAGATTILLTSNGFAGIDISGAGNKNLVGSTIIAADASTGLPIDPSPIPANTVLLSYTPTTIELGDASGATVATTIDIPDGSIIYFNYNTLIGDDQYVTSMLNVSSKMNPEDTYNAAKPGMTTNTNFNPNYSGDPDFLEDKFVRFSYRFKYEDGTNSIMAPFTQAAFIPQQDGYFMGQGTLTGISLDEEATYRSTVVGFMENKVNNILLQIPLPLDSANNGINASSLFSKLKVDEIEILYKESDSLAVQVVDSIPRTGNTGYERFGSDTVIEYNYQGTKPYKTLPENEIVRVYDKVPVRAHGQEIISNRVVYSNFQNKHTPPESLDYNVTISDKYTNFVVDEPGNPILPPLEKTVSREYPMHTVKQNRNYQVGIVLSDRFGRSSTTLLSSSKTQSTNADDLILDGDTIYFPYNDVTQDSSNSIHSWPGDSIKILFNSPVPENIAANVSTGWPGLYNGNPALSSYNPLGWYSYKVVVKQTEQEYYNVYLPGLMNFYPNIPVTPPDPTGTTSFITLLNDNINKVPRDLSEVGPEQKQFRSSVVLYGRVAPENDAVTPNPTFNYQFNPTPSAVNIAIPDTVSTISTQNDMFNNPAADPGGATQTVEYSSIYQTLSNPLLARVSIGGNTIGSYIPAAVTTAYNTWLSVYETAPVESRLDIYWETTSSGTISQLNEAIKEGTSNIKGFTTEDSPTAPETWTFNLYEDITPGASPTASYNTGTYTEVRFFPYVEDSSGTISAVKRSNIETSGFSVRNGNNTVVTDKFILNKYPAPSTSSDPDKYSITIAANTFFYFNEKSDVEGSYTFTFEVENLDGTPGAVGSQYGQKTKVALTEKLSNIKPSIDNCETNIVVLPGATSVYTFTGVNGSADTSRNTDDLTWSMTQSPAADGGTIPQLSINAQTGEVTVDEDALIDQSITMTVVLRDAGNDSNTYNAPNSYAQCITAINGKLGYETFDLNEDFYSVKNMCIGQGPESSGFYWARDTSGTNNPITTTNLPSPVNTQNRVPITGSGEVTTIGPTGVQSVTINSAQSACSAKLWKWRNTNRNGTVQFDTTNSGFNTINGRSDTITSRNTTSLPQAWLREGTPEQPGGTAYIIVDFEFTNPTSWDTNAGPPSDRPEVIWPVYLQYRPTDVSGVPTGAWVTAKDIEGNEIRFGGTQGNNYQMQVPADDSNKPPSGPNPFTTDTGVLDKLSVAKTAASDAPETINPFPDKEDCFDSWFDGISSTGERGLSSVGRKMFCIGRNQGYRSASTGTPESPDMFGEYRLLTRYPYSNNISVNTNNKVLPTLTPEGCPSSTLYNDPTTAKATQKVYLSFGDFYNPVQLRNTYSNNTLISTGSIVRSYQYTISPPQDTREEAEQAYPYPQSGGIGGRTVWAKEWGFKYVTQFYKDEGLSELFRPGVEWPSIGTDTKYYSYASTGDYLNANWGNDYASTRNGSPIWDTGWGGVNGQNEVNENKDRKWTAQFDYVGEKIRGTAQPCVANLVNPDPGSTPPSNTYSFGVTVMESYYSYSDGNAFEINFAGEQYTSASSSLNMLKQLTGKSGNGVPHYMIPSVISIYEPDAPYTLVGEIRNSGSSTVTRIENYTSGSFNVIQLVLKNVSGRIDYQPGKKYLWNWPGITSP